MGARFASGIVGGLVGGVVFGVLATVMTEVVVGDGVVTLMRLVGRAAGSGRLLLAWMIVLGIGALLGAIFGILVGRREHDSSAVASYGLFYGLAIWLLVGFVAVPVELGVAPFAVAANPETWSWLPATLVACLLFAGALAGTFIRLRGKRAAPPVTSGRTLRRAA
ncbi:MAG TPA: hypothetical protein VLF19_03455 [Methylomirabilota bacterium]|nr:hypothetical protein [Methylomirabilota bacterium]